MVTSQAKTVREYLAGLPADRRPAITALRKLIRQRIPPGFEEGMLYGMIGYYVPLARYPKTYNGQPLAIVSLGAQKNHMALYMMSVYGDPELERWFSAAFRKAGKKLDMGKSCVRFRSLDDLPLDVIGEAIARTGVDDFIASYERSRAPAGKSRSMPKRPAKPAPARKRARRSAARPARG